MAYKLNHVLFSGKKSISLRAKKIFLGAVVLTAIILLAANWGDLTKSQIERFREAYDGRRFDEALQIALDAAAADPSSVEALQAVTSVYIQKAILRQDFDASVSAAFAAVYAALELDSENVESHRLLGLVFEVTGDVKAAAAEYEKALKLEPQNVTVMAHLAAVYEKLGKVDMAEDLFQRAVLAAPENDEARVLYARFLLRIGKAGKAIELIQTAVDSEVPLVAAEANRILSASRLKRGETDKARAPAELALALAPDSALAVENYGRLLLAELFGPFALPFKETLAEVRQLADKAAALDPSLAAPNFLAFKAAYSQNDKVAADRYARKTLELLDADQTLSAEERGEIRQFIRSVPLVKFISR